MSGDLDSVVREGDLVNVTCVSLGGNPPPELSWYRGNSKLQYGATRQVAQPALGLEGKKFSSKIHLSFSLH